jgi:hypothetical protein
LLRFVAALALLSVVANGCGGHSHPLTAGDVQRAFAGSGLRTHVVFSAATRSVMFGSGPTFGGADLKAMFVDDHVEAMVGGPQASPQRGGPLFDVTAWIFQSASDAETSAVGLNALVQRNVLVIVNPPYLGRVRAALATLN